MGTKVVFSPRSRLDLKAIVEYIAQDDPVAAERFGLRLIAQAEKLADSPEMGVSFPAKLGIRFFPCGPYLIFYRLDVIAGEVRILRFWHSARGRRPSL